jgi:hypothetical protein
VDRHEVTASNAALIAGWIKERGGIAIWRSINLSNPSGSWTCPVKDKDGNVNEKPNWQCASTPARVITDLNEVAVLLPREVRRFHVAVRHGSSNWFQLKLTDASTRKLNAAKEKAGEGSWHEFDYSTQEAVIYTAGEPIPLLDYLAQNLEVAS